MSDFVNNPADPIQAEEGEDRRISTVSHESQSYPALVWRRFRRSVPGMFGLVLVIMLLIISVFAEFFAPVAPRAAHDAFAAPAKISWYVPGEGPHSGWRLLPVSFPIVEGDALDPITYQPLSGPDYENPRKIVLFAKGWDYHWLGIPMQRHFIGTEDGTPLHVLGTDKLGRDILSRGIIGSRISLAIALISITLITMIGTMVGITSGYLGGRFDLWLQRVVEIVLAFPQLPLYLALTTLIPVTAPSNAVPQLCHSGDRRAGLGAALTRSAIQNAGPARGGLCARRRGHRGQRRAHHHPPYPAQRDQPCHRFGHAGDPDHRALGKLPWLPRLCGETAADLMGADAPGCGHVFRHRLLPVDPVAGRLRADHCVCFQRARRRAARCD